MVVTADDGQRTIVVCTVSGGLLSESSGFLPVSLDFSPVCTCSAEPCTKWHMDMRSLCNHMCHGPDGCSNDQSVDAGTKDDADNAADVEDTGSKGESTDEEEPASATLASLKLYKEALANNDESRIAEIEALLISIEEEKLLLESKVATLSEELSNGKARVLRISADFDNFRKRTERERLSLVTNAQGEVVENLLPVLDNFERAEAQIKVATEGEEKINNSYQSIYKQFVEVLGALGVVPVETTGNPFDPLASLRVGSNFSQYLMSFFKRCLKFVQLHEAIMREDSAEYEEDVIIQEFRKGFKLGDRLLRPSMVKVSAGPGPAKPEPVGPEEPEGVGEVSDMDGAEPASSNDL
ncbi:hypothetical protein RJ639_035928 [Escallonia herrerae]|uniref:GrpE protein homolog n=1 Tax=Escallonia herrerae TaxID=1293975 RepID=A0AA89B9U0_9ASTE|nr:hypothetical protein RJ639_035928 [Escallonia herrerae]